MTHSSPQLLFEFPDLNGKSNPLTFLRPAHIVTAYSLEEIIPALHQLQEYLQAGFYVAGWLSYEAGAVFISSDINETSDVPYLWFGVYDKPIEGDFLHRPLHPVRHLSWESTISKEQYHQGIQKIKEEIAKGNTYQVNYTLRVESPWNHQDPLAFYRQLTDVQQASYTSYIDTGRFQVLSASPELFFRIDQSTITTRPMKGTMARGNTPEEDHLNKEWLANSEKNRAENVMIVDLLRNDLGKVSLQGTVRVPELFSIETYPTLFQMTSTITAKLEKGATPLEIFRALFPCGSITGAPKRSTMQIIKAIEDTPRNVYCGAIGFWTPKGDAIFNVPIRTVLIDQETQHATYGVGGGITWDSTAEEEYEEVLVKTAILQKAAPSFQLIESILLKEGHYWLADLHEQRIFHSAKSLDFPCDLSIYQSYLTQFALQHPHDHWKVRVTLDHLGHWEIAGEPIQPISKSQSIGLATTPISRNHPYLYHKTTERSIYQLHKQTQPDLYDVLLWNEQGELTEFTTGNLVLEIDGLHYTPPISSGLLNGTFRQRLIQTEKVLEKVLHKDDLTHATQIWLINSVRGWVLCSLHA
ncbi:aminodeoxychorismate synthase component I [Thermoactinomyces sp. DSM 45892]|uniref:aminodeoxychorismate synthase component I n=1 Tax=Thermoactinomyces sp. DSM 45892 TaxID=1882753 RepID=UPI00089B588F|nr:aminodeoxychorismate synthase component I [Thermoactinomyces sp. DSM 45892]SDY77639.1 aminodeoxychorismate synthase, subunit I /aminodeoxychorismate lyase apoprotein [Thermoactinomyces sp. DSM 45892]